MNDLTDPQDFRDDFKEFELYFFHSYIYDFLQLQ